MDRKIGFLLAGAALCSGCETAPMGVLEALQALGQVGSSARGEQATADVIEVSTDFTIGGALEQAAAELASFWESQAPCAEVTLEGAVATIDYGTLDDDCTWHGRTYAGISQIGVASATLGELEVEHTWIGLTNGQTAVDGGATVTWSGDELTRRVVTEHTWTDEATGEEVDVRGDHITGRIEADVPVWLSGFTLDGTRDWTVHEGAAQGEWALEMEALELRLIDPAPQAGTVALTAPSGRSLNIDYARVDDDTISATLHPLRGGDRVYHISRLGAVEEAE